MNDSNRQRSQSTLFDRDGLDDETKWVPPSTLPDLARYDELWVDTETTGLNQMLDQPLGLAIATPDDRAYYLPFGHRSGNLDAEQVKRWARRELRNKTLVFSWGKFDAHMFRNWGLPLDELNVRVRDVQHQACLLNERRLKSGLDLLAKELLNKTKHELSAAIKSQMAKVHSSLVGAYAEQDVRLTRDVDLAQRPLITREGLDTVLALEDSVILPVVEMEHNGARLDVAKLHRWRVEVQLQWENGLKELQQLAGFAINPDTHAHMARLFRSWNLEAPLDEETGKPTFAAPYLLPLRKKHPGVALVARVKALRGMLVKFLIPYCEAVGPDGKLRYNLHQLRADDYGTITGRFSAADENIQQVYHPENQEKRLGTREFLIRELFIPEDGLLWVSADAQQIEYRLFAGRAGNADVLAAFDRDPDEDFHQIVTDIVREIGVIKSRKDVKNVNFAKLYGAGIKKIARMLECSREEAQDFINVYDAKFPEVGVLTQQVSEMILARHHEGLGYVRTALGRRRRYPKYGMKKCGKCSHEWRPARRSYQQPCPLDTCDSHDTFDLDALYTGLNAHIQGTAADINKIKLRQVYDARKHLELTMRFTVHDELDGDITTRQKAAELRELLNEPALPDLKIPIRWATGVGSNWANVVDLCKVNPCSELAKEIVVGEKKIKGYCPGHAPALKEAA